MKKITFLAASLVASLSYGQDNLVVDGTFDDIDPLTVCSDTAPWFGSPWVRTTTEKITQDGNSYLKLDNFTAATDKCDGNTASSNAHAAQLKQDILFNDTQHTAVNDDYFVLSLDLRNPDSNTSPFKISVKQDNANITEGDHDFSALNGGEISGNQFVVDLESLSTSAWTNVSCYFKVTDVTAACEIFLNLTKSATSTGLEIDNVEMKYVADTNSLSVKKLFAYSFSYSPNPANNLLKLTAAKNIDHVDFFNLLGQKVLSSNVQSMNKEINISDLNEGVYMMNVRIGGSIGTYKIVKK